MKRLLYIFFAIVLVFSLSTSCTKNITESESSKPVNSSSDSTKPATSTTESEPVGVAPWDAPVIRTDDPDNMEWMYDVTPVTLSIYKNSVDDSNWTWGMDDDVVANYITERTGVTLEYIFAPDNTGNKLTLMLAGGDKLPDFIQGFSGSSVYMTEMIEGEYIYPITDLIDEYCPMFESMLDPAEVAFLTKDNGKIYSLPNQFGTFDYFSSPYFTMNGGFAARADVLEAMGNPKLETTDDLLFTLDAFDKIKDKYPEIKYPFLTGIYDIWTGQPFYSMFGGVAGMAGTSQGLDYNAEAGTVEYFVSNDIGRSYLSFLNQIYRKGYITPDMFAVANFNEEYSSGSLLFNIGNNVWMVGASSAALAENVPGAKYLRYAPIVSEAGADFVLSIPAMSCASSNMIVITKDSENPERAIKFLQYLHTEEANLTLNHGLIGEHYEILTDDKGINYTKRIGAAEGLDFTELNALGIHDYRHKWLTLPNYYDVLTVYANRLNEDAKQQQTIMDAWTTSIAPPKADYTANLPNSAFVEGGSDLAVLKAQCEEVLKNEIPKVILSNSDTEFDASMQAMLKALDDVGVKDLYSKYIPILEDLKVQYEAMGYNFIG
ncbi:MAG: extracellular solute-binding protein [Bacillota bacterium]|nr:extracellular solute-binding protein [Bacillota bacterium]